jgi:hypothetical protein
MTKVLQAEGVPPELALWEGVGSQIDKIQAAPIAAGFVLTTQNKLAPDPASPFVSLSFKTSVVGIGADRRIVFEVRNHAGYPVYMSLPVSREIEQQLKLGQGTELPPEASRRAEQAAGSDLFFINMPVLIHSTKAGTEAVVYIPTIVPSVRRP